MQWQADRNSVNKSTAGLDDFGGHITGADRANETYGTSRKHACSVRFLLVAQCNCKSPAVVGIKWQLHLRY
jgi:hypothetical protein